MPFDGKDFALPVVETDDTLRILERTRALLAGGHCKARLAADMNGVSVDFTDKAAASFCLTGAHSRARIDLAIPQEYESWQYLCAAVTNAALDGWYEASDQVVPFNNDPSTTQHDVVAVLDRAIAARRAAIISKAA